MLAARDRLRGAGAYVLLPLLILVLSGCPEREVIRNLEVGTDAAILDSEGPPARIILLIGDGMGRGQIESASYFKTGTPDSLALFTLPIRGRITTSSPSGITDSAASATAMASGHFTLNGRVGLDLDGQPVQNLVELAKSYGLATGIVTTTRVAHATPASFTAHVNSRGQYEDIAEQIAALRPDVVLGGGRNQFEARGDDQNLSDGMQADGYQVVHSATELRAARNNPTGPLLGLFAASDLPYVVDRGEDDDTPTLSEMTLAALEQLDPDPQGFFLMVEGGRIDHAGHGNRIDASVGETLAFDDTVAAVMNWAGSREDVTILVTADHETGGLQVNQATPMGVTPDVSWRWGNHTNATVQCFGKGPGLSVFDGFLRDHRWVHSALAGLIRGRSLPPLPAILPNGHFDDLLGPTIAQARSNPGDPATRLTRLTLGANERGLGIGLEGLYRWDQGGVVVLIDVDYGLATGLRNLNSLSDEDGSADAFLSRLQLPTVPDNRFGAELAFFSQHGLGPSYTRASAGLRGLLAPYGAPNQLASLTSAANFSDNSRSNGEAIEVETGRGLEIFINWQELYGQATRPANVALAVWAVQVNEDGSVSNQSMPPWLDDDATRPPAPLVYRP
jgi:alkaline phosphatase